MKQGIPIEPRVTSKSRSTYVKSMALMTFKLIRSSTATATKLPSALQQAGQDIAEAWAESKPHPKP